MALLRFTTVEFRGERTIERVSLLMNIVPCKEINLTGLSSQHIIEYTVFTKAALSILCLLASTEIIIGETGATSLSEALRSNTTLTQLYLSGEHTKKQHTNGIHQ